MSKLMKTEEIKAVFEGANKRVTVWCDEMHGHSVDCIVPKKEGDTDAVVICKLVEHIQELHKRIQGITKDMDADLNVM